MFQQLVSVISYSSKTSQDLLLRKREIVAPICCPFPEDDWMLHFCQDYVVNWYIVLRGGRRKRKYDRGLSRICRARPGGSIAVPEPLSTAVLLN